MAFNYIQTFYLNSDTVKGSPEASLTSVDLYFKYKPKATNNRSGVTNPNVSIYLCPADAENANPALQIYKSLVVKQFNDVYTSTDSSVKTSFVFEFPITLKTNRHYGIVVVFQDPDYELWMSKQGDKLVGTNLISSGPSGRNDGYLFETANAKLTSRKDVDLKFQVNAAKYSENSVTVELVNDDYEFLSINNITNSFLGGEKVYQDKASITGTVTTNNQSTTIIGSGTSFTSDLAVDTYIVITDGSVNNTDIRLIESISTDTRLTIDNPVSFNTSSATIKFTPIADVYYTDYVANTIILDNSTAANATFKFTPNSTIIGEVSGASANIVSVDDYSIDNFFPEIYIEKPAGASITTDYLFAQTSGNTYLVSNTLFKRMDTATENEIKEYDAVLVSKSNEVLNTSNLYSTASKSGVLKLNLDIEANEFNEYATPSIFDEKIDLLTFQNEINNDSTNEHLDSGNALTKYISTKISLGSNRFAEDIRTYLTAYKPASTNIKVYARIHNSKDEDAFDDKYWTELKLINNTGLTSSLTNPNDFIELEYGFPQYPESNNTLSGTFTTSSGNAVILTSNDQTTTLANGDLIKIYNPLFAETNHQIATVLNINSTAITINEPVSNTGLVGSGYKADKLKLRNTAFNNILNDNVVRYFSSSMSVFDTYDTLAIKIVLLSNTNYVTPRVEDVRTIAVSA